MVQVWEGVSPIQISIKCPSLACQVSRKAEVISNTEINLQMWILTMRLRHRTTVSRMLLLALIIIGDAFNIELTLIYSL